MVVTDNTLTQQSRHGQHGGHASSRLLSSSCAERSGQALVPAARARLRGALRSLALAALLLAAALRPASPAPAQPSAAPAPQGTGHFFAETGFGVDDPAVWGYFTARGGVDSFGYPVSRTFGLLGFPVQVFQRHVLQVWPDGSVHPMNLLDPDVMPVTSVNFSRFPAHDPAIAAAAPPPGTPDYGAAVLAHLQATVPDTFEGQPVNFLRTYLAAAPGSRGSEAALVALELWGFPTSLPAADPTNASFVYQRFQRGILHYDAATGTTRGILLADTLKAVLTGRNLPRDVDLQMQGTRFLRQYCPSFVGWLCRPTDLPATDLRLAFEPPPVAPAAAMSGWTPVWNDLPVSEVLLSGTAAYAVAPVAVAPVPAAESSARTLTLWRTGPAGAATAATQQVFMPVARVDDGGATWQTPIDEPDVPSGSPPQRQVALAGLAAELPALNRLFAGLGGVTGRGVLVSEDGGATWGLMGSLDIGAVAALSLDPARNVLYAGTDAGLWRLADPRPRTA